jgi:putative ABC transport system permease protein
VWRLFRADLGHQTKRIVLTVLAIAWGTLSIVLLLSFGEGLKRSLQKGTRGGRTSRSLAGRDHQAFAGCPRAAPSAFATRTRTCCAFASRKSRR